MGTANGKSKQSFGEHGLRAKIVFAAVMITIIALTIPSPNANAQTLTPIYEFQGGNDGAVVNDLIRDAAGNLYGTTIAGGTGFYGTVFKLDTAGTKTILHNFGGGRDGNAPHGNLVMDAEGNLYGTAEFGGDPDVSCTGYHGCGVVFKVDQTGRETTLYSFTGGADGAMPLAGLYRDHAGNLYGTTAGGGKIGCIYIAPGCGVVFKLTPAGQETVLYSFGGANDSGFPASPVIRDSSGNLYGMTTGLGANGYGTVFKIDPAGNETILHRFKGRDGGQPYGSLIRDAQGNLYGTAYNGGYVGGCGGDTCGVVFQLAPAGHLSVLHAFTGGADGSRPVAGLTQDYRGNLYGTAASGGAGENCCGVVFKVSLAGHETVLYTFTGGDDGGSPQAAVIRDATGNIYGSAGMGTYGAGVIFKLTP